ncbi:WD40 repeat-like protein, partial [Suillus brevipes Sb2]
VHAMAVSPKYMNVVATGSQDGRIRLWTVATGEMTGKWKQAHSLAILSVCWSPDELNIASGSEDGTAIIWDTKKGDIVGYPIRTAHPHVYAVRYSCDGGTLLTSGYNNAITFWDVKTREAGEVARLGDRTGPICAIVLSQDKLLLATASLDNTISLWDPDTNQSVSRPLVHPDGLRCAAFARKSRLLATSGINKNVYIWDL